VIGIVFVDFVTMALLVVVIGDAVDMLAFAIAFLDKVEGEHPSVYNPHQRPVQAEERGRRGVHGKASASERGGSCPSF
ncbi:MAG: hypothetical protein II617_02940, partial [Firmicutes bacterium]|nr:hypothetical protein [Bacillota bacterium]